MKEIALRPTPTLKKIMTNILTKLPLCW